MKKMMPIGPLMIEHRLLERMVSLAGKELDRIKSSGKADSDFIDTLMDFMHTYADRCHHGKEEDILFRELKKKHLSEEHSRTIDELLTDHAHGREINTKLIEANKKYVSGDEQALSVITDSLSEMLNLYPQHIEKEDKHFFLPAMSYFTEEEKDSILAEEYSFDQSLIHEKYREVVRTAEDSRKAG
jgi:hemerythrin-like domain-containing protein